MAEESSTRGKRVLLAEDDQQMRELFARIIKDEGVEVVAVHDGLAAIARLAEPFDLVVTDIRMPGANGMEVLAFAQRRWPELPVVAVTAFGSIPGAVDAMRAGAFDYLSKPLPSPQTLRDVVRRALSATRNRQEAPLVVEDPRSRAVFETAERVAPRDTSVLLLGESGVGKEVVARHIHEHSARASRAFVAVNCAAIAESLLESELFGHERGAFTGAIARHKGRFEQADGGTLLLDEVGETSPSMQAKLLRVLQEGVFDRVGAERPTTVDVRIIAATNRDLRQAVAAGAFRDDLYYRLAVFPIEVPALRHRPADILPLAQLFLRMLTRGKDRTVPEISREAVAILRAHDWPGNVRELQNTMERALVLSSGGVIEADALALGPAARPRSSGEGANAGQATLKEMERRTIEEALGLEHGNRKRAAKRLGIALRTLQYKLKEYGLIQR